MGLAQLEQCAEVSALVLNSERRPWAVRALVGRSRRVGPPRRAGGLDQDLLIPSMGDGGEAGEGTDLVEDGLPRPDLAGKGASR